MEAVLIVVSILWVVTTVLAIIGWYRFWTLNTYMKILVDVLPPRRGP